MRTHRRSVGPPPGERGAVAQGLKRPLRISRRRLGSALRQRDLDGYLVGRVGDGWLGQPFEEHFGVGDAARYERIDKEQVAAAESEYWQEYAD
jgi:hypothetical protein